MGSALGLIRRPGLLLRERPEYARNLEMPGGSGPPPLPRAADQSGTEQCCAHTTYVSAAATDRASMPRQLIQNSYPRNRAR